VFNVEMVFTFWDTIIKIFGWNIIFDFT